MSIRTKNVIGLIMAIVATACLSQLFAAITQNPQLLVVGKGADGSIDNTVAYGVGIFGGIPLAAISILVLNAGKSGKPKPASLSQGISADMRKLLSALLVILLGLGLVAAIMLTIAFSQL